METLTKLTVLYPIPCPCSKNDTSTPTPEPSAKTLPVINTGAGIKDAPPGLVTALGLGGVAIIFFVLL
jgi:hypothetical protein